MPGVSPSSEEYAVYLYGFSNAGKIGEVPVPAIDGEIGSAVFLHPWGQLIAIAGFVRAALFTDAEARLQDPIWVTAYGCHHTWVLQEIGRQTAVFPVPFGTLFSSLESLEHEMQRQGEHIAHTLATVAERDEWAVKGILDRVCAQRELLAEKLAECTDISQSPGRRHLQEQHLKREAQREVNSWLKQNCLRLAEELSALADGFRSRRLLPQAENDREMILNWAYLVPRENTGAFCAQVQRAKAALERRGLVIECSGAWPPYSFCGITE